MKKHNLKYVHFDGCALNFKEYFGQYQCPGTHEHEPTQGTNATASAYYTPEFAEVLFEALYPKQSFKFVPDVSSSLQAMVTKNLTHSEWLQDPKGLQAVLDEAEGLRGNKTWDDESVTTLDNLKHQARQLGISVHTLEAPLDLGHLG